MSRFAYLITEGVTDATLIVRVLRRYFSMQPIKDRSQLPEQAKAWLGGFKWPTGDDISRLSVPAPVFLRGNDISVAVRNAEGLTKIQNTLKSDDEVFYRSNWQPDTLGILLDGDNETPADRLTATKNQVHPGDSFPPLTNLQTAGSVATDSNGRRVGVFVFPDCQTPGTLENLLLPLGESAFADLHAESERFIASVSSKNWPGECYKEFKKPAGSEKALLSTMAAVLKPGKNLNASIQDHDWVPSNGLPKPLEPVVEFLQQLIG